MEDVEIKSRSTILNTEAVEKDVCVDSGAVTITRLRLLP